MFTFERQAVIRRIEQHPAKPSGELVSRRSGRVRFSPSRSFCLNRVGPNVPRPYRPNGAAFSPDVAAATAAPQAVGKDRRANLQILSQLGMTHWTGRHQRPPLMTAVTGQAGWLWCSLDLADQRLRRVGMRKRRQTVYRTPFNGTTRKARTDEGVRWGRLL